VKARMNTVVGVGTRLQQVGPIKIEGRELLRGRAVDAVADAPGPTRDVRDASTALVARCVFFGGQGGPCLCHGVRCGRAWGVTRGGVAPRGGAGAGDGNSVRGAARPSGGYQPPRSDGLSVAYDRLAPKES
jgi:hypothetical protein